MAEEMEMKGSVRRIKSCAFDLIAIGSELMEEDQQQLQGDGDEDEFVLWDLIERELRLKSTFLYCDFAKMISLVHITDHKNRLTQLANKLFDAIEEVDNAVKERSMEMTQDRYGQALLVLRDVIALMP
uniref:Uncharacterized protein n=1 Tax=Kalanchoe fedtschenkoi TaxID=63787 RepID=A0A7N0ZYR9_KALFE